MKIGLLAMSGIRAHDPKLLELGLTHLVNRAAMGDRLPCRKLIMITGYLGRRPARRRWWTELLLTRKSRTKSRKPWWQGPRRKIGSKRVK